MTQPSIPTSRTASIIGTGSYVPEKVLTNAELEKLVETSDEWIRSRTGIRERRIAGLEQPTSDLAANAAKAAMENAGITAGEIDLIICATVTPDMFFPSTACFVQTKIGAVNAACFDLSAACSGFLFGIETARNPRITTKASRRRQKSTRRQSKVSMVSPGCSPILWRINSTLSPVVKSGLFASLSATPTITSSKTLIERVIRSRCPWVTGSKLPG